MTQQPLSLPVDVWLVVIQHLPLADLVALHTALASSPAPPVHLSVIKGNEGIQQQLRALRVRVTPGAGQGKQDGEGIDAVIARVPELNTCAISLLLILCNSA